MSTCKPTMKTTFLLVSILLLPYPSIGSTFDLQADIDPLAKQLLDNDLAVGFVVGIYKNGEIQVIGYGETEKGKSIAPRGDTIYEIGSASKVFTGVLLAHLVQNGRVKLDDPMQKYLSKAAKDHIKNPSHINFEHLATHTSGLPRLPDNLQPADLKNPYTDYTFRKMYEFLKDHKLRRAPGEYEYSNFGMGLLGVLLASREKMSYEELLIERIAKPCGMNDTCIKLSDKQRRRLAPPYDTALQAAKNWDIPALAGAGGIRSTTNDMLKFIEATLAAADKPLAKALQLSLKRRHTIPDDQAIGLGWHIAGDGITRWHNGMTGGYASWVAVVPGRNVGVVVLSNTAAMQITKFGEKITRIAYGEKNERSTAASIVPRSDYPKKSPFAAVRWQDSQPEVKVGSQWYKLVSLDDLPAAEIVAFSKQTYGDRWQKRFEEDLVELLTRVGHAPQDTVTLVIQSLTSEETRTLENVAMTEANRRAIKAAAGAQAVRVPRKVLQSYEGVYAITPQFAITVTLEGDKLMVQATGQQKFQVYPKSETKFFYKVVDAQLTFVPGKNGKADRLILHQNGANQVATRRN